MDNAIMRSGVSQFMTPRHFFGQLEQQLMIAAFGSSLSIASSSAASLTPASSGNVHSSVRVTYAVASQTSFLFTWCGVSRLCKATICRKAILAGTTDETPRMILC